MARKLTVGISDCIKTTKLLEKNLVLTDGATLEVGIDRTVESEPRYTLVLYYQSQHEILSKDMDKKDYYEDIYYRLNSLSDTQALVNYHIGRMIENDK